jgi:hypothetical protein
MHNAAANRSYPEPTYKKMFYSYKFRFSHHVSLRLRVQTSTQEFWPKKSSFFEKDEIIPSVFIMEAQDGAAVRGLIDVAVTGNVIIA